MILSPIISKILRSKATTPAKYILPLFSIGFLVWILALLLTSCSSIQRVQTVPVESILHDTLYINKAKYDSIYINNSHLVDRDGDTVYIKDKLIEYRYRFLRDTIRIVKCDSIPYEVRITEVKEVPRRRNLFDYISYVCFGIILGLVVNKARAIVRTST